MSCPISALLNHDPQRSRAAAGQTGSEAGPLNGEHREDRSSSAPPFGQPHLSNNFNGGSCLARARSDLGTVALEDHGQTQMEVELDPPSQNQLRSSSDLEPTKISSSNGSMSEKSFNIFAAIMGHGELIFDLARELDLEDLISLYAISRDFHYRMEGHFTSMILSQSLGKAPESSRTFLFKAYKSLCRTDPAGREHPDPRKSGETRLVPSFRWLRMVFFREKVVEEIIACLATKGIRLPPRASLTLKRMWLTMDIPHNYRRIGLMHNRDFWTDEDLYVATLFFIKIDMRFTDPVDGYGAENSLRKLLLGQRSLSTLGKALKREALRSHLELLRMYVRYAYRPAAEDQGYSIFGIPPDQIGKGCLESWGKGTRLLLRPDQLVMKEAVKRDLCLEEHFVNMMLWGYIDPITFENIKVKKEEMMEEGISEWKRSKQVEPVEVHTSSLETSNGDVEMTDA
ncbi:MAG: hypothetical protein M1837_004187 [Sclerophora amabilis]|nr:MAG: hypothetical protein M1837_004187 [Sclerophora amabilis]